MTLDSNIFRTVWTWKIKTGNVRTSEGNISNLSLLKQVINVGLSTLL